MKYLDSDCLDQLRGRRLKNDERFSFRCHAGLACFNQCCRNLNLFLYPYDVIRIKQRLGISSDQFIEQYVDVVLRPSTFFPEVLLRMAVNDQKTCPFLTDAGCSVYADRPDTCRSFPLERGVWYDARTRRSRLIHVLRPPDFCLGQHEHKSWTPVTWLRDQQAETHNRMTLLWAELRRLFQDDPWGAEGPQGPKAKMAFMATYNVDRFREFVFNSTFLTRYKVPAEVLRKAKRDDVALMRLGFDWVKFFLWGVRSRQIRFR